MHALDGSCCVVLRGRRWSDKAQTSRGWRSAPHGAIPKQNPDRTISDEVRVIGDLRINNADGHVLNHAPALTPRHREIGRSIVWWDVRLPHVLALVVKLDVVRAFTLVWLRPADCGRVSTEIAA